MQLPQPLAELLTPLFTALPMDRAMSELVPTRAQSADILSIAAAIATNPTMRSHPPLLAGLWLYVDDLDRSHAVSQSIETPVGSLWHGIMHRREGDFWNSKYWFRKAGAPNPLSSLNPGAFVDRVEQTYRNNPPELLDHQRREWQTLFEYCAKEAK